MSGYKIEGDAPLKVVHEAALHSDLGSQCLLMFCGPSKWTPTNLILVLALGAEVKWDPLFGFLAYNRFLNIHFLLILETNIIRSFLGSTTDYKTRKRWQRPTVLGLGYKRQEREPGGLWWQTHSCLGSAWFTGGHQRLFRLTCWRSHFKGARNQCICGPWESVSGLLRHLLCVVFKVFVFPQPFCSHACFPQGTHMRFSAKRPLPGEGITLYKQNDPLE